MTLKYRTEKNSRFINVWMKNLVHESWKRGRLHSSWATTTCIPACDSKAPYLLMVIWKGISQEDLLAPSTRHPRTVLCTKTDRWVIFHPSCMSTNVNIIRYWSASTQKCTFLCHFLRFDAVMHFSPAEFSSKSLHIIHRHQRVAEWDCVNVWHSPRIAVCV